MEDKSAFLTLSLCDLEDVLIVNTAESKRPIKRHTSRFIIKYCFYGASSYFMPT